MQPNGGEFSVGWSNSSRYSTHKTEAAQNALGCLSIAIPKQRFFKKNRRIIITANDVEKHYAFYGVHIKPVANSVSVSKFARAGASIDWFLNLTNFSQYVNDLAPDLILLNIGTNDWLVRHKNASQYYQELRALVGLLHEGSPTAKIIILEPNAVDMSNRQSQQIDHFDSYRQARINVCQEIDFCEYFDIPSLCGDYRFFEESGYMHDPIHPNAEGKKHIADQIFNAFLKVRSI